MEILASFGIDVTTIYQFVIFLFVYIVLTQVLFKPYFKAYSERQARTVGKQDTAERLIEETEVLETQYEKKAREINSQYKTIYDQTRTEALREHDKLLSQAREKAKGLLEQSRERLKSEIATAKSDVSKEIPEVSKVVVGKLLGKDLA